MWSLHQAYAKYFFVLALNLNEVIVINDKCAVFDILCSFVTAERIHYLEYE